MTSWQVQGQVPVQSPGPKKGKRNLASGRVTKILRATTHHPPYNKQEGKHEVLDQVQEEHYQRMVLRVWVKVIGPVAESSRVHKSSSKNKNNEKNETMKQTPNFKSLPFPIND